MGFKVIGDYLYYDKRQLGPASALYVDSNELKHVKFDGVVHLHMPKRIDFIFAVDQKVVGVESKLPADLANSVSSKRLSRQIKTLRDEVDVVCLLVRGLPNNYGFDIVYQKVWNDLVRLQALGVFILPGSQNDEEVVAQLYKYREFLGSGRSALAAIAGTDSTPKEVRRPGWFLRGLRGIGGIKATRLHRRFGSTRAALAASDAAWKEEKMSQKVLDERKEAMK